MLTSLPSLLIIPFILLGGKLTEKVDYVRVLKVGLWLFAASGISVSYTHLDVYKRQVHNQIKNNCQL